MGEQVILKNHARSKTKPSTNCAHAGESVGMCLCNETGSRLKYPYKKGTRTLKPSFSWFEPAYESRFDAHGLIFTKCRVTLM